MSIISVVIKHLIVVLSSYYTLCFPCVALAIIKAIANEMYMQHK